MKNQNVIWALVALGLLLGLNAAFTPGFFHLEMRDGHLYGSLVDILDRAAPVTLMSLGMALVIATGGIDLSVGSVMAISGAVTALTLTAGASGPVALMAALGAGLIAGLINGSLVAYIGIQPIVATLILMVSGRGVAQLLTDGQPRTFSNDFIEAFGSGFFLTLPFSVTVVVITLVIIGLLVRWTALGLYLESVGNSPKASRLSGLPVPGTLLFAYATAGICAGLAGVVGAADIKTADANTAGLYYELDAILAVVIGGTALTGGRFTLIGSVIGALLMQALTTTILARGIQMEWTQVVKASVILIVCILQSRAMREKLLAPFLRRRRAQS
jgi:simple sugar transport system permease protein